MNRNKFIIFFIILLLSIPYTYGGCVLVFTSGDIEREKDPEDSDTSTDFAGRTTQAVIDSTNANDLSGGAIAGGITRIEAARAGFDQDSTDDTDWHVSTIKIASGFKGLASKD